MWIRTASERDLNSIQAVLVETWHDTYNSLYGAEKVSAINADWHSTSSLRARLNRPRSEFIVADTGSSIKGVAFASLADGKIVELHQLYVVPAAQGQGAGGALLQEIEACFPEAHKIRLEVEAENQKAIAFYAANGFEEVGATENCGAAESGIPALLFEKAIV